jgi:hypothetical protein
VYRLELITQRGLQSMASRKARERMLADVRSRIEQYGWAVQAIGSHCVTHGCRHDHTSEPEFAYTAGLSRFHGHSELIVFGLPQAWQAIC